MTEQQGTYVTEEELKDANEMLGAGYDHPTVTVEPPKRTMQRRGKKMVEIEEPAFVKFSTDFKTELADLDVYALKVFIYIGLSIGFDTGTAFPGVRKIAKETNMNKGTVVKAIEELEEKGFLKVWRKEGGSNTYKPTCYFAIGEGVPLNRTVIELSGDDTELSGENVKLSGASRVKSAQQDKQEEPDKIVKDDAKIFQALEKLMGSLNTSVPRYVDTWLEKHPLEWILKAIEEANTRNARSERYVDKILIGWEANGYPKSRDEQVKEAKKSKTAPPVADDWLAKKEREFQNVRA